MGKRAASAALFLLCHEVTLSDFSSMGKSLVILGLILTAVGGFFWAGGKLAFIGWLPGDIGVEGRHFKFYFPLTTCLLISVIGSALFWLLSKFK